MKNRIKAFEDVSHEKTHGWPCGSRKSPKGRHHGDRHLCDRDPPAKSVEIPVAEGFDYGKINALFKQITRKIEHVVYQRRFVELAATWRRETRFLSSVTRKSTHIAYQKIIGMGEAAIPFILQDMNDNGPDDWFWALHCITDENPITEDIAGDMEKMTEAWLQWGRQAGYLNVYPKRTRTASQTSTRLVIVSQAQKM